MTESGGSVNSVNKLRKVVDTVRDGDGDTSSGLKRSSRAKSSWTPFPKEDCCARRRALGELSRSAGLQKLPTEGCYCPEECTGVDIGGCENRAPVFTTENCVHMAKDRGLDPSPQSLRAKKDILAGTLVNTVRGDYTAGLDAERSVRILHYTAHTPARHSWRGEVSVLGDGGQRAG
jgi:hypothetical protein